MSIEIEVQLLRLILHDEMVQFDFCSKKVLHDVLYSIEEHSYCLFRLKIDSVMEQRMVFVQSFKLYHISTWQNFFTDILMQ